jgi:hypothetical protein
MHTFRLYLLFLTFVVTPVVSEAQKHHPAHTLEKDDVTRLTLQLDSIYEADQKYRQQIEPIYQQYGPASEQMKSLADIMSKTDSVNLKKIKFILDRYGWLGADQVGEQGNVTLFLVIQHADKEARAKYLPMMREAVKNKKANPNDLAKLEDRVACFDQGKKQIYGTHVRRDEQTKKFYLVPLEDPENVDKRRAKLGLPPLDESLSQWGIRWNLEEYKKEQAEAKEK